MWCYWEGKPASWAGPLPLSSGSVSLRVFFFVFLFFFRFLFFGGGGKAIPTSRYALFSGIILNRYSDQDRGKIIFFPKINHIRAISGYCAGEDEGISSLAR